MQHQPRSPRHRLSLVCAAAAVLIAATLPVATAGEAVADPGREDVIKAYAPIVHLHPNEHYQPMDASVFVARSELKWSHGGNCCDHTKVRAGGIDAAKLGSGGYHDQAERTGFPRCEASGPDHSSRELTRPWDKNNRLPNQPGRWRSRSGPVGPAWATRGPGWSRG